MKFEYVNEDKNAHTSGHTIKTQYKGKWYTVADAYCVPATENHELTAGNVAKRINDLLNEHGLVPKPKEGVNVRLTLREAKELDSCINNGYGDGDWLDYLKDRVRSAAFKRGWEKLQAAIREARK